MNPVPVSASMGGGGTGGVASNLLTACDGVKLVYSLMSAVVGPKEARRSRWAACRAVKRFVLYLRAIQM